MSVEDNLLLLLDHVSASYDADIEAAAEAVTAKGAGATDAERDAVRRLMSERQQAIEMVTEVIRDATGSRGPLGP